VVVPDANGAISAFDAADGDLEWTVGTDAGVKQRVTVLDGALYATANRAVHRLDPATGAIDWTHTADEGTDGFDGVVRTPPLPHGDALSYARQGGTVRALDPNSVTAEDVVTIGGGTDINGVVADDHLFISASDEPLTVVDLEARARHRQHDVSQDALVVTSDTLYSARHSAVTAATDRESGTLQWRYDAGKTLAHRDGTVYTADDDGLYALRLTAGAQLVFDAVAHGSSGRDDWRLALGPDTDEVLVVAASCVPWYVHEGAHVETVLSIGDTRDQVTGERHRDSDQIVEFTATLDDHGDGTATLELTPLDEDEAATGRVTLRKERLPDSLSAPGDTAVLAVYLEYDEEATPEEALPESYT
jgi:hypothetical protein